MSNYVPPRSVTRLEEELAELERLQSLEEEPNDLEEEEEGTEELVQDKEFNEEVPASEEEKTWKKRHGDLRRHEQKIASELKAAQARIKQLEKEKSSVGLPSAAEAEEWAKANPKAASIIRAIAAGEAAIDAEEITSIKSEINRSKQFALILKTHPDFEEVVSEENTAFHDWAEAQPETIQNLIYSADASAKDMIWVVNQFKKETVTDKPNPQKEAAKSVKTTSRSVDPKTRTEGRFSESMVDAMSMSDFEKNQVAIQQAMRDGTFIYDRSGGAR